MSSECKIKTLKLSLSDLLGAEYTLSVCRARSFLEGIPLESLRQVADEKIDFYPAESAARADELLKYIGRFVCPALTAGASGAGTAAFTKASKNSMAPLSGLSFIRIGEDGRAYFVGKSEHYHSSLGHNFPGYKLIDNARKLGILNATHNNTRGHITRLAEETLIRIANGLKPEDRKGLDLVLKASAPHMLNKVINLETGSLAMEAALKMMLARFYRLETSFQKPVYDGKVPVFLVMGDREGGLLANYHGTSVLTQTLRGMWPDMYKKMASNDIYHVLPVPINDIESFKDIVNRYDNGKFKIAGFFHELVLMNYGGIKLERKFINDAHDICHDHDIPTVVDEIQSCIWSPELFLFKEYGLKPDFVSVGKGFPGGEYPASKILVSAHMDNLNQFGALVTNGQEELASLAYLITIAFAEANAEHTACIGKLYEESIRSLAKKYPNLISAVEGYAHMTSIFFYDADICTKFVKAMNGRCIDVSAQTYKASCPPAALTKIPLVSSAAVVKFMTDSMAEVIGTF